MRSVKLGGSSIGLAPDEVHVWRARLEPASETWSLLSLDERARADGFRSAHHRHSFLAARSILRQIMAGYVHVRPEALRFEYGPQGKPSLLGSALRFSVSHAADMAIYAVAFGLEIGVDLESASVLLDPESIVQRCMSKRERRSLDRVDPESRDDAVLTTWVRKEAVAKGRGDGLGLDMSLIETNPGMPSEATPVKVRTSPRDRWFIWDVPVGEGGAGAVATRERHLRIKFLDYVPSVVDLSTSSLLSAEKSAANLAP